MYKISATYAQNFGTCHTFLGQCVSSLFVLLKKNNVLMRERRMNQPWRLVCL